MSKCKITLIEILWSESGDFQRRYKDKPHPTFTTLRDADDELRRIARYAGRVGYEKTDYKITWEDGFTYKGRYDIHCLLERQENPNGGVDLADEVRGVVTLLAGLRRPQHLTDEQYESLMRCYGSTPETQQAHKEWLETHEL